MHDVIDHLLSHPWIVALMAVCFTLCMVLFRARVRKEDQARRLRQLDEE